MRGEVELDVELSKFLVYHNKDLVQDVFAIRHGDVWCVVVMVVMVVEESPTT
jgi:hypothetical protein